MTGARNELMLPDEWHKGRYAFGFFEQFDHFVDGDRWTAINTDAGSCSVGDAQGGVMAIVPSDGTVADNDESYLHTTNELFLFDTSRPIILEALVQFTEANTDDANIMFGLMSGVAANALLDDAGGPAADDNSALFYKVDGGTAWICETSCGTDSSTQTKDTTDETAGGSAYQRLRIEVAGSQESGYVDVTFYVDTLLARIDSATRRPQDKLIKHKLNIASASEMAVVFGAKNGGANNETFNAKYVGAYQLYG